MSSVESKHLSPERVRQLMAIPSKYQPYRGIPDLSDPKTAIRLADIPLGEFVKVFLKRSRFKDRFGTETTYAKVLAVKETPQIGNDMVEVQIDGWHNRRIFLAGGTATVRVGAVG